MCENSTAKVNALCNSCAKIACCRLQLKCDGTRWRTGGEVQGKLANAVGSQYSSHYLGTWCIQHYYSWCAHLGCQQSTELTPSRRLKWTRPFRRKTKSGFCACAITFQLASTPELIFTFVYAGSSIQNVSQQFVWCIHLSFVHFAVRPTSQQSNLTDLVLETQTALSR